MFAVQSNSFDGQNEEIAMQNNGEVVAAQPLPSRARVSRSRRHRSHRCALPLASVAGDEQFQPEFRIASIEVKTDEGGLPTAEGAALADVQEPVYALKVCGPCASGRLSLSGRLSSLSGHRRPR